MAHSTPHVRSGTTRKTLSKRIKVRLLGAGDTKCSLRRLFTTRIERADHELPVGCESVVGSFTRSPLTHVARDCLT